MKENNLSLREKVYLWWLRLHIKYEVNMKKDQVDMLLKLEGKNWGFK